MKWLSRGDKESFSLRTRLVISVTIVILAAFYWRSIAVWYVDGLFIALLLMAISLPFDRSIGSIFYLHHLSEIPGIFFGGYAFGVFTSPEYLLLGFGLFLAFVLSYDSVMQKYKLHEYSLWLTLRQLPPFALPLLVGLILGTTLH